MSTLADKVIALTKPYLGPATDAFLSRQCGHLKIELGQLTQAHLKDLAPWIQRSGALVMDAGKAAELAKKVVAI